MIDVLFKPVVFTVFIVEDGNILFLAVVSDKMKEVIMLLYVIARNQLPWNTTSSCVTRVIHDWKKQYNC